MLQTRVWNDHLVRFSFITAQRYCKAEAPPPAILLALDHSCTYIQCSSCYEHFVCTHLLTFIGCNSLGNHRSIVYMPSFGCPAEDIVAS